MAVQPIDLQTMYSQIDTVARTQTRAQQAVLSDAMQQQKIAAQNSEKASQVQQAAQNEAKALHISDNSGGNSGGAFGQGGRRKDSAAPQENAGAEEKDAPMREEWLGRHVDITG